MDNQESQVPGKEVKDVALALARKWWSEGKLSHNWNPDVDVDFLAIVIENKSIPEC